MKYMGSKNRYAKQLLEITLKDRQLEQWYVEPFCGGCNVIDKVDGNRIANDINWHLIEMWKVLVYAEWQPPEFLTWDQYQDIKNNKDYYPSELVGFVGIACSYAGKWFGGFARGNDSFDNPRNYCDESRRNVLKQVDGLRGTIFYNREYSKFYIPENSIVYCDPPYQNTTKYKDANFNHEIFWDWIREMSKYHKVFVSEYSAPKDFKCVWEKSVNSSLDKDTGSKQGTERLFTIKN